MTMEVHTGLDLCGDGTKHIIEEIETIEHMSDHASYHEYMDCSSIRSVSQNDPFHADWPFW
jgi:hypothetical protein